MFSRAKFPGLASAAAFDSAIKGRRNGDRCAARAALIAQPLRVDQVVSKMIGALVVAFLSAYFDESGTHADSKVVIVVGALAKKSSWISLEAKWKAILKRAGTPAFHASPFNSSKGAFLGWDNDRKKDLAIKLTRLMNEELSLIIAHGVKADDFNIVKSFSDLDMTAYQLFAEKCLAAVTNWAQSRKRTPSIAVYFEAGHDLETEAISTYRDAVKYDWLQRKYKIGSISILPKKNVVQFQIADFVAYEAYKYHTAQHSQMLENLRPSLRAILQETKSFGYFDKPESIRQWFDVTLKNRAERASL
jgi:hypothetical protein